MKKRVLTVVLAMLMAVLMITPALAIVEPTDDFYVADYANVLSSDTEQEIIRVNGVLENTCNGAQLVVVAVEYLDGLYSDEYALQVMNDWGVGDANEDNGMVLVFATKENKGWLATGDGIDSYFTDSMADDYLNRYFWDSFDKGQYDKAVNKLVSELTEWYEDHYDAGYGGNSYYDDPYYYNESYVDYSWIIIVVIFVAVFILVAVLGSRQHYRSYYVHMGMPIPRFHIWHMWSGPHRHWHDPHRHHHHHTYHHHHGGSGGFGGGGRGGSGGFRSSGRGGGGFGGGGGGGRR